MKKEKIGIRIVSIVIVVATLLLMIPAIYVSKYSYPWSDDFSYGADAHNAFINTGSVFAAIGAAFMSTIRTYFDWQGTYTSCFLMSLHPAVWNVKLYHLTEVIMAGTMMLSYLFIAYVIFTRIFKASKAVAISVASLTFLVSAQCVRGIAEAFTWYNSAVHYTFNNAWYWFFVGLLALYLYNTNKNGKTGIAFKIILGLVAFLVAGGNNISVIGGVVVNSLIVALIFLYQKIYKKESTKGLGLVSKALPFYLIYMVGSLLNFLAPGNGNRLSKMGDYERNPVLSIIRSFQVAAKYVTARFSIELLVALILIGLIIWYAFAVEKCLDNVDFSFPLPGVVILLSFCALASLATPLVYTGNPADLLHYVYLSVVNTYRAENVIFFDFVLFLVLDLVYLLGWVYKKGFTRHNTVVSGVVAVAALILLIFDVNARITELPTSFLTSTAIADLNNSTASYYGYQMAENTYRLTAPDSGDVVYVMPIAVSPNSLYPFDAEDWIYGTKLFYNKESVVYESEPYVFTR